MAATKPEPRYSVVVDKKTNVRVVFSTRLAKIDADLIVVRLAAVGCHALVVPMIAIDAPGMQRRLRSGNKDGEAP